VLQTANNGHIWDQDQYKRDGNADQADGRPDLPVDGYAR
jgi:hypothetical protein